MLLVAVPWAAAEDHLAEGPPEVAHGQGVDDGVHARVDIAQPRHDGEEDVRIGDAVYLAHPVQHVGDEEGKPADDEHPNHDAESLGGFLLPGQLGQLLADGEVSEPLGNVLGRAWGAAAAVALRHVDAGAVTRRLAVTVARRALVLYLAAAAAAPTVAVMVVVVVAVMVVVVVLLVPETTTVDP